MNKIIETDMLKAELKYTTKLLCEALFKLDQIKMLLKEDKKTSRKEILEIIDGRD